MKKVLVVGTGISGIGAAKLLKQMGRTPIVYDANGDLKEEDVRTKLQDDDMQIVLGDLPENICDEIDMAVLSPGVPTDIPMVLSLKEKGIKISGEIELAYGYEKGKLAAITGTNGKTTTTTLVGDILAAYYEKVFVVGNIGNPYTIEVPATTEDTYTVAEISSFQLETTDEFHPTVSAILNITPDHLNRHHTMEGYIEAKERIALKQTKDDWCVLNYENEYTKAYADRCPAQVVFFSSKTILDEGLYLDGEDIYWAKEGAVTKLMNIHADMNLVGICNVENVMAAIAIATGMNVPMDVILDTVRKFKAVEHRIEFVATKNGVDYYNDSKGTNPDAAIQGIKAMSKPTILIGGGYDKQSEYDEWIEAFDGKVKCFVLIGQTREKIKACAEAHGIENIILKDTFEDAFATCVEQANPGDAVLLSPACASWGMFPNYEVRGKMFKEMVHNLKE